MVIAQPLRFQPDMDVRGAAIGLDGQRRQGFVMQNAPKFTVATLKAFLGNFKWLAKATDKVESVKIAFSKVHRSTEALIEKAGGVTAVK
ncbi:hypothetical protein WM40_07215 [Robbsia andropogonis]|uniref:Uncharacterized protein n=1 Tax=Robbsia andropogonis TaxID=28092 RepID=A0A0F5K2D9_9BURK|nr:hypothetical protein [Robbsia andropogonis]KKB64263.1 hypothetical protein WM40_07215 [Robbsia andropogonis]